MEEYTIVWNEDKRKKQSKSRPDNKDPKFLTLSRVRAEVWKKTGGICIYCGEQTIPWESFHIDHFDNEAGDDMKNLWASCPICNLTKNDKTIEKFKEHQTRKYGDGFEFYYETIIRKKAVKPYE